MSDREMIVIAAVMTSAVAFAVDNYPQFCDFTEATFSRELLDQVMQECVRSVLKLSEDHTDSYAVQAELPPGAVRL